MRGRRKGPSIVFVRLVDPGLFDSLLLGPRHEDSGDGANAVVSGRVADRHEGDRHPHAVTVPVLAMGGQGPTGAKGRVVGAGAAESRGPTGAKGAVIEAKKAPRGRKIRRPTGAEGTANSVGRGGGTTG